MFALRSLAFLDFECSTLGDFLSTKIELPYLEEEKIVFSFSE
jgi:hypothetical protein